MPPSEASAPGSIGKNRPWSRRCSLSALRVMPGSTTQSRSSAWTASTLFMSRKSMRDAAARRIDVALERGAGAERDHRHALGGAQPHDVLHVLGRLRKHHRVRRLVGHPGQWYAVLLAHRLRGDQAVAEARGERGDDGGGGFAVALGPLRRFNQGHCCCLCVCASLSLRPTWRRRRRRSSREHVPRLSRVLPRARLIRHSRAHERPPRARSRNSRPLRLRRHAGRAGLD